MRRKFTSYPVNNFDSLKTQMLNWANQFGIFAFLDNHKYNFSPTIECVLAADATDILQMQTGRALEALQKFSTLNNDWIFGHLGYDLKNEIDHLSSENTDHINFPDMFFFIPDVLLLLNETEVRIGVIEKDAGKIFNDILSSSKNISSDKNKIIEIKSRFTKPEYISIINQLQKHILRGDCYEINFCQEFFAIDIFIEPLQVYNKLVTISPNPFSALYRVNNNYLLCASPERFLKKTGSKIFSQPIKGTSKRKINNENEDEAAKSNLLNSEKERSENVMVVDLVRNDLSKICIEGSVKVDELFGIYSFPQVHQMISTISGQLNEKTTIEEIIRATFPMGSMTGTPKKRVMELIEKYEKTKRGIFSGALGYITPDGDFDFNVVIRSIFYNSENKYLSMQSGSAITFKSDAEKEYEECLIKIEAMKSVLV